MKRTHDIITVDTVAKVETERAYLFENIAGKEVWIPKSQCEYENGELQIPERIAEEKGLI